MTGTRRLVNQGAEDHMLLAHPILDKGFIHLVDYMGTDETVVAAARHSYGKGLDPHDHEGNNKLINFLMKNRHTSPFEQPAMVFEVKAPIFVFREWHRHRTAKLNEMSARYTVMPNEYYVPSPERIQYQSKANKQGSGGPMSDAFIEDWSYQYQKDMDDVFKHYEFSCAEDMAKEVARVGLPVSTYSKMIWQCDLHNLMHFMKLRCDGKAQFEIRQYADKIKDIVADSFPKVHAAFDNHVMRARTISGDDIERLRKRVEEGDMDYVIDLLKQTGVL